MCGQITLAEVGQEVTLAGWVQRRRDHGGLIFVDLRDRSGIIQIVFSPDVNEEAFHLAEKLRNEYVVRVVGTVMQRPAGLFNPNISTGDIEIYVEKLEVLNASKLPPFFPDEASGVDESVRLRYRYLDLRRPEMQENLKLRHEVTKTIRNFLDRKGFWEIETPILTKSSPEGARDYLVPSRIYPGKFFALPQSPQLFKQLLMVSGIDKYFQIARCFRDEDLRADRQPEFTQIDLEASFITRDEIIDLMEEMVSEVFDKTKGIKLLTPFPRLTYQEAMDRFGTDRPDLRFGIELVDVSDLVVNTNFKVFSEVVAKGGQVKGINAKDCAKFTRKEIDELTKQVSEYGAKGLAWIAVNEDGVRSPIAKFFSEETISAICERMSANPGDLLLFVADKPSVVAASLGYLRVEIAKRLGLIIPDRFKFCWVVDFPLFEYDEEEKRFVAMHHPFTSPMDEDIELFDSDPGKMRAKAYDLILNGVELGGGSIRIHRRDIQEKMFKTIGISAEEAQDKFGYLLEAFDFGAPPHGGIAFGLDRFIMLLAQRDSIRDVIAFPKTQSSACLLTKAPSEVEPKQLKELHIKTEIGANNRLQEKK
jgi:aspartyl-tRNA synthetase